MKILILSNHFLTLHLFRLELISKLLENNYEVVISTPASERNREFEKMGCRVIPTKIRRNSVSPFADIRLFFRYLHILKNERPDYVFSYTIKPNIFGSFASRILGIKQICNITGTGNTLLGEKWVKTVIINLYRFSVKTAHKVYFQNKDDLHYFKSKGMVADNFKLIPGSGVNLEKFQKKELPPFENIRFIFVGRIMKIKGIEEFIQCAEEIKEEFPQHTFAVAGFIEETNYKELLEDKVKQGTIEYLGFCKDMPSILEKCHCLVCPSHGGEGLPNAVLEASAMGRIPIGSRVSGIKDVIVEGYNGFLFEPKDQASMCQTLKAFILSSNDLKTEISTNGHKLVESLYDRKNVIQTYLQEIENH